MARRRSRRDPALMDVFRMWPRGHPCPRVMVYRDRRDRFIEVMKIDRDVRGLRVSKRKK